MLLYRKYINIFYFFEKTLNNKIINYIWILLYKF